MNDLSAMEASTLTDSSPYPGLTPFSTEQHNYFFGREAESRILLSNMFASRLTVVHGPSGVGKSSLLNAGLMPAVNAQDDVLAVVFRQWAGKPTKQLQRAVRKGAGSLGESIDEGADLLATCRASCEATGRYLMLVLDQFEEFFLYPSKGTPFDQALGEVLADNSMPFRVLISMREDSLARLDRLEDHVKNPFDNIFRLEHLTRAGGMEAIVRPLEQYEKDTGIAIRIEEGLATQVLDGVRAGRILLSPGGGGVPEAHTDDRIEVAYLQLVMERMWTYEIAHESSILRASTLTDLGGVRLAVRSRFTELMDSLSLAEQDLAARLFYFLVTPSKTKIAWSVRDLAHYAKVPEVDAQALLGKLAEPGYRVLRTVETLGEAGIDIVYEIYHDILARAVVEWKDKQDGRSEEQVKRLRDLRDQLTLIENHVEDGDSAIDHAWYPLLVSLAAEAQTLDPGLATHARELAGKLASLSTVTKSSRSAALIERRQVKLLQDQASLLIRTGGADLAYLYLPRLTPFLDSSDAEVRRDATLLAQQLLSPADDSSLSDAGSADPSSLGGSLPEMVEEAHMRFRRFEYAERPSTEPLLAHWDLYALLLAIPLLNLFPLVVTDIVLRAIVPPYEDLSDTPRWLFITMSALGWTSMHLYAVIDNGLRYRQALLVPFAPWSHGVVLSERTSGWPTHVLLPLAFGGGTMYLASLVEIAPDFAFYTVVTILTLLQMVMFAEAESLVWNPYRLRKALRFGREGKRGTLRP